MLAWVVAALTLWLIWLGYGYDLGYLGEFGLSPEQLGRGTSDFLLRSYRPLLVMAESLIRAQSWETQQRLLLALAWPFGIVAALATLTLALGAYAYSVRRHGWTRQEQWLATPVLVLWRSNLMIAVRELASPLATPVRVVHRAWVDEGARWKIYTRLVGFAGGLAVGGMYLVVAYVLIVVSAFALGVAITAVSGWPLTATQAGRRSALESVIRPTKCGQPNSFEGPHCLRVVVQGCELARGRLIDRTSQRIFVFVRAKRAHVDLSLEGSIVEDVPDEIVPPPSESCAGK